MSEAAKRYVIRHGCVEEASSLLPGERAFVLAADHDRIVSALIAGREAAERENAALRTQARALELAALELRAEVERLKQDAELEMVIQRAASELPDGWEIRICVERGAGWVELTNPDGEGIADEWSGRERLSGEVSDAIDATLEASQ